VTFAGITYQCLQAHRSLTGWEPPNVPALWARPTPCGLTAWATQTIYVVGSQVTFNGQVFLCIQAHTSVTGWEPTLTPALWKPVVLDQSFTAPINLGASFNDCCRFVGQTYTAGVTGTLVGAAIDVFSSSPFALHVAIRDTTAGVPNDTILGQVTLGTSSTTLTNVLPFSVPQVAGHKYAIVGDYPDAPPPSPATFQGTWSGATGNGYASGGAMASADNGGHTWFNDEARGFDLRFQTFVAPN
jgi:hypothetical protein